MKLMEDKVILVTGGTGSMGKVLVKRILSGEQGIPRKVIVLSRDEAKQHAMRLSYENKRLATDEVIYNNFKRVLEFRIGDVRVYGDVVRVVKEADIIINAAALKQVPTCEYFPYQAVLTNCLGAENIVRAIVENNFSVETVVGVSTDKACKPINVMGMTKAIQERIFINGNIVNPNTRFICVRYGNVLASRGSVVPVFHDQIRQGCSLTLTHPEMTRYLLSINDAVDTVFAALKDAAPGQIFTPVAPAVTMLNLAKALIEERDIAIKEVGIRPGEKMHESMISLEESRRLVEKGNYRAILPDLPELLGEAPDSKFFNKSLTSADDVLDLEGTKRLLARHCLRVQDIEGAQIANEELFC